MRHSSPGIAIGPILFVIAILAVLATAISAGSGSISGNTDREKAEKMADALIAWGEDMRAAYQRVSLGRGCQEIQVSFVNPVTLIDYTNPYQPADGRCNLFNMAGGGLTAKLPNTDFLDPAYDSTYVHYGQWHIPNNLQVIGVGTNTLQTGNDLYFTVPYITDAICTAVNKRLGYTGISGGPAASVMDCGTYRGTYQSGNYGYAAPAQLLKAGCTEGRIGHASACNLAGVTTPIVTGVNVFYYLLLAR